MGNGIVSSWMYSGFGICTSRVEQLSLSLCFQCVVVSIAAPHISKVLRLMRVVEYSDCDNGSILDSVTNNAAGNMWHRTECQIIVESLSKTLYTLFLNFISNICLLTSTSQIAMISFFQSSFWCRQYSAQLALKASTHCAFSPCWRQSFVSNARACT